MTLKAIGLFCEDIREEKSGQVTLVGILPDNVAIPPMPETDDKKTFKAVIPKLGLYVRIQLDLGSGQDPMEVKLVFPDKSEASLGTVSSEIISTSLRQAIASNLPYAGILHHALLQGFSVPAPGLVTAVLETGGERHVCGAINFQIEGQL